MKGIAWDIAVKFDLSTSEVRGRENGVDWVKTPFLFDESIDFNLINRGRSEFSEDSHERYWDETGKEIERATYFPAYRDGIPLLYSEPLSELGKKAEFAVWLEVATVSANKKGPEVIATTGPRTGERETT